MSQKDAFVSHRDKQHEHGKGVKFIFGWSSMLRELKFVLLFLFS